MIATDIKIPNPIPALKIPPITLQELAIRQTNRYVKTVYIFNVFNILIIKFLK